MAYPGMLRGWQHRRRGEITLASIPDLSGKVAVVTGASGGLGMVCSRELAKRGAKVYLACRSLERAEAAMTTIRDTVGLVGISDAVKHANTHHNN